MKICNRDYSDGSILATKTINGLACCTYCEKPALCHNKPIEQRALFWALSGDTGVSSETLCAFMTNNQRGRYSSPPSDASDRGRCIRLLELIPEWIERLPKIVVLDQMNHTNGIVIDNTGMHADSNSWARQIPLILQEGKL